MHLNLVNKIYLLFQDEYNIFWVRKKSTEAAKYTPYLARPLRETCVRGCLTKLIINDLFLNMGLTCHHHGGRDNKFGQLCFLSLDFQ